MDGSVRDWQHSWFTAGKNAGIRFLGSMDGDR